MSKPLYSKPKIVKYDDLTKYWYVYFRYNDVMFRFKKGINFYKTYKERLAEAEALRTALEIKLKEGWNPLIADDYQDLIYEPSKYNFPQALTFAIEKKKDKVSKKTFHDYSGTLRFLKKAILKFKFNNLKIVDVQKYHIRMIFEETKKTKNWSNKAFNKHLGYFKSVLSELVDWDVIQFNPAHAIKSLREEETIANVPATNEQHLIIKNYILQKQPNFYNFVSLIYHTGIRPYEALQLKVSMINLKKKEIILPADITKTIKDRIVPINNQLDIMFESLELQNFDNEFYIFGSNKKNGGRGDDFVVGPRPLARETATRRWKKLVKDDLKIDVNLYSNKHKGANDKILAGISLDALRELYGHSSKLMTEHYAKVIKEVYRKQILENSPDF